jgi:hypothetical protein
VLFNKDIDQDFELSSNLYRPSLKLAILYFGYVFQQTKLKTRRLFIRIFYNSVLRVPTDAILQRICTDKLNRRKTVVSFDYFSYTVLLILVVC